MGWILFWLVWTVLAFAAGVYAKTKFDTVAEPVKLASSGLSSFVEWAKNKWRK